MFTIFLLLIGTKVGNQPLKKDEPIVTIYANKIKEHSNFLFGEEIDYDVYSPHHPNWGGLRWTWTNSNAWDIFVEPGTPVYSIIEGKVFSTRFKENKRTVWGYNIIIENCDEKVFYTHLDQILLCPGDSVKLGQLIGYVGQWPGNYKLPNGQPMPAHLHLAIYNLNLSNYLDCSLRIKNQLNINIWHKETKNKTKKEGVF